MKYIIHLFLIAILIVAGFFGYSRYRETEALKARLAEANQVMAQDFSLVMNGWNAEQAQLLFEEGAVLSLLEAQMAAIKDHLGACQMEDFKCNLTEEKNVFSPVYCSYNMDCEKSKGFGDLTWTGDVGSLKIQGFRVRRR